MTGLNVQDKLSWLLFSSYLFYSDKTRDWKCAKTTTRSSLCFNYIKFGKHFVLFTLTYTLKRLEISLVRSLIMFGRCSTASSSVIITQRFRILFIIYSSSLTTFQLRYNVHFSSNSVFYSTVSTCLNILTKFCLPYSNMKINLYHR